MGFVDNVKNDKALWCGRFVKAVFLLAFVIYAIIQFAGMIWAYQHPLFIADDPTFLGSSQPLNFPAMTVCNDLIDTFPAPQTGSFTFLNNIQCGYNVNNWQANPPTQTTYSLQTTPTTMVMTRGGGSNVTMTQCYNVSVWGAATKAFPFNSIYCEATSNGQVWINFYGNGTNPPHEYYHWASVPLAVGSGIVLTQTQIDGRFTLYSPVVTPLVEITNTTGNIFFAVRFNWFASLQVQSMVPYNIAKATGYTTGFGVVLYGLYAAIMAACNKICGWQNSA